ncbi:MAG: HDIG domain-containing protein [Spirochaetaceae bacterium]|jgi:putative nucleotidyltransferase with HDIG domain|nr:HDIG domain-containing protein [Spirochaetaceae bacterium]
MKTPFNLKEYARTFFSRFPRVRSLPVLVTFFAFVIVTVIVVTTMNTSGDLDIEVGRVAERDIIAEQTITYTDEYATGLRIEAQKRLVPAVFIFSELAEEEMLKAYQRFISLSQNSFSVLSLDDAAASAFRLAIQTEFPGFFFGESLDAFFMEPDRELIIDYCRSVLDYIIQTGVFALPKTGLESYNPEVVELLRVSGTQLERERINYRQIVELSGVVDLISRFTPPTSSVFPVHYRNHAIALVSPFVKENVFFSSEESEKQVAELATRTAPVINTIEEGKKIIRKGFIVSEEDIRELRALNSTFPKSDIRIVIAKVLIMLLLYGLLLLVGSGTVIGRRLKDSEIYLVAALATIYIIGSVFTRDAFSGSGYIPSSIIIPTALAVMLPSILIDGQTALALALLLPLSAFLAGSFDLPSYIFALISGVVASVALRTIKNRMDLLKAGLLIACANMVVMIAILLETKQQMDFYPLALSWAALNGIACGMLVLGFLPPLERALNAVTVFRLVELSDLNAPILKQLFSVAPGTYSHSLMVANLAETACQDIGANPLLARVGAYYHDIGKMKQPQYFVENQSGYNPHNDIPARLSATIIRSHVKFGVEKALALKLPQEVVAIISEHHGNSVIAWFYNKALEQDSNVSAKDFSYPGNPPHTRESAVVMLADVSEAAVRTLEKPNAAKIEKFVQDLITGKVSHGQLAQSELTFQDLETIKKAFVKVLTGYYHSRIEYPKAKKS